jgi:membrane fusion protein (multidrug efflux system)
VDAFPDHEMRGRVESLQRGTGSRFAALPAQNATGNWVKVVQRIPVRVVLDEEWARRVAAGEVPISPGMSAEVEVRVR